MILGPLSLPLYLLTTIISLAILGGGITLIWDWYTGVLVGIGYLVAGIVLTAFSFLGRWIVVPLLGKRRPPVIVDGGLHAASHRIKRPSGAEIYVEQLGVESGPTVILTHGLSMDAASWKYVVQELARHCRVFVWDVPGFGRSRGPTGPANAYTMETLADDLQAVVQLTGTGPVVLAGHSMGGMLTLTYCRRHAPELGTRVVALILAQTSYTNPVKTVLFARLMSALQKPVLQPLCYLMIALSPIVWLTNVQGYLSGIAHLGTHLTGFAGNESSAQLDFAARYAIVTAPESSARALLAMFRYDATDVLPTLPIPALILTGDRDIVTLPSAGETIAHQIPRSEQHMIGESGHLGLLEQYGAYASNILPFVQSACQSVQAIERRTA